MVEESSDPTEPNDERARVLDILAQASQAAHAISRSELMRVLSDCPAEVIIDAARKIVQNESLDRQKVALEAISYISKDSEYFRDGVRFLLEVLKSTDEQLILESLTILTRLGIEGLSEPFLHLSKHSSRQVRKAVSFALAGQQTEKSAQALIELSRDPTNEVRLWALHQCHQIAAHGVPELRAMAKERLDAEETGGGTPTAPIVLLARRSDPDVPRELRKLLRQKEVTEDTLKASLELKDPALFEYLWEASWHWRGDPELMASTLEFCRWDDPRETDELVELALTSKNYIAAEQAVALLQRRDTQEVFDTAVSLTYREEFEERHLGARVLGRLGGPHGQFRQRAVPSLVQLLEDKSEDIVAEAVRAIGEGSADTVSGTIKRLQNHPHGEVRRLVSVVLYGIKDHSSAQALVALSTAREGMVRLAASQALSQILTPKPEGVSGLVPSKGEDHYDDYSRNRSDEVVERSPQKRRREPARGRGASKSARSQAPQKKVLSPEKSLERRKKLAVIICIGTSLALMGTYGILSHVMENQGVEDYQESAPEVDAGPVYEANADDLISTKARSKMFGARRAMQVASMLSRPPSDVLTNKSDTWYLYFRMDVRDATAIVTRAPTPDSPKSPEWTHLDILVNIISDENNSDQTEKSGQFAIAIAARNGPLASHIINRVLDDSRFYQTDDFILAMGEIDDSFKRKLLKLGIHTEYHPALQKLDSETRSRMADQLRSGLALPAEHRLAQHLEALNAAADD